MNKKIIFGTFILALLIIGYLIYLGIPEKELDKEVEEKEEYQFPDDYHKINCNESFIGDLDGECFTTPSLDSFVYKKGDKYTVYTLKEHAVSLE